MWNLCGFSSLLVFICVVTRVGGMQIVRKDDLCVVSLKNEARDEAWMASHNRLALCAQADNAAHCGEELTIVLYLKLRSCALFLPTQYALGIGPSQASATHAVMSALSSECLRCHYMYMCAA
jgi:hypothetical protein